MKDLESKIEKLRESNSKQDVVLERLTNISERNADNLEKHMARTNANESRILQVEESLMTTNTVIAEHLSFLKGVIKTVVVVSGIAVTVTGILIKLGVL